LRKAPYQLAVFWPNFRTKNARNSIKGSKNEYSGLESKILQATILARGIG